MYVLGTVSRFTTRIRSAVVWDRIDVLIGFAVMVLMVIGFEAMDFVDTPKTGNWRTKSLCKQTVTIAQSTAPIA